MKESTINDGIFGNHTPWRSDPVKFTDKPGCEIVRGTAPGYYRYAVDGVFSSKQVDAVQLVEWEMAEIFSSELFAPFERGVEFNGAEIVVRDISSSESTYLIEREGDLYSVNLSFLVAEKSAMPSTSMREAARRRIASLYESQDTPWLFDEIRFKPSSRVKIVKGKERGKYVVDKGLGYTLIYSAARLIAEGFAEKDDGMYDAYYNEQAVQKKWSAKKRAAFYETVARYALETFGYDDGDGEISSLYDCVLFLERASDYGTKKEKTFFEWINEIFEREKSECDEKSNTVKAVGGLTALLFRTANVSLADVQVLKNGLDRMKKSSKLKGKDCYCYSMFFAHARRKPQGGATYVKDSRKYGTFVDTLISEDEYSYENKMFERRFTDAVPIVKLFDGDWWERTCEIAETVGDRAKELERIADTVTSVADIVATKNSVPVSKIFSESALVLDKKAHSGKAEYDKKELESAVELAKKAVKALKKAVTAAGEVVKIRDCLNEKTALYEKLWNKVKNVPAKKKSLLFAKARNKPFDRRWDYHHGEYKFVFLSKNFVITRRNKDRTCVTPLGTMELEWDVYFYEVKEKKTGIDYGVFDEETLVYCGLAEWRIK